MRLEEIASTSAAVAAARARLAKIERLSACLRDLTPEEIPVAVAYLSGRLPQGTIGVGWAALRELPAPGATATLDLLEVDAALTEIAAATGPGSQATRRELIAGLFERTTEAERGFLFGLLSGELRQGALEGIMVEAVARAADLPAADVRRAAMLAGDLGPVAADAMIEGVTGLARYHLSVLAPVQPMLAQTAATVTEALARTGRAAVEWKLDGARIQVHRLGDDMRVFTRNLADVTDRVPELVATLREVDAEAFVLDGEAIALREDGRPHPFQVTMGRFGSRLQAAQLQTSLPLSAFFFDCLHANGRDLIDLTEAERFDGLTALLSAANVVPRMVTDDPAAGEAFLEDALRRGHEGVMVKSLDGLYEAGRRGAAWLKVKRAHTLDLVVLAAEWGHGRRQGWLSNLHLGARDPEGGGFVMLGKTFKGMTDEMLSWQTERLLELETGRHGIVVEVRPELVVEVAFDGLQASTRYPGGLALRFARIKGYRHDKAAQDADTIDTVRSLHTG